MAKRSAVNREDGGSTPSPGVFLLRALTDKAYIHPFRQRKVKLLIDRFANLHEVHFRKIYL